MEKVDGEGFPPVFSCRRASRVGDLLVAGRRWCREGGSNSVVESQPSKLLVAGSIPVSRSSLRHAEAVADAWLRLGRLSPSLLKERSLGRACLAEASK